MAYEDTATADEADAVADLVLAYYDGDETATEIIDTVQELYESGDPAVIQAVEDELGFEPWSDEAYTYFRVAQLAAEDDAANGEEFDVDDFDASFREAQGDPVSTLNLYSGESDPLVDARAQQQAAESDYIDDRPTLLTKADGLAPDANKGQVVNASDEMDVAIASFMTPEMTAARRQARESGASDTAPTVHQHHSEPAPQGQSFAEAVDSWNPNA